MTVHLVDDDEISTAPPPPNARDKRVTRMELKLRELYEARRGETRDGWVWCRGCGTVQLPHNLADVCGPCGDQQRGLFPLHPHLAKTR